MSEPIPDGLRERAQEAVTLWEEYGLTIEFLEGMTYNHRVALIAAARRWLEAPSAFSPEAVQAAAWAIAEHRKGGWPEQAAAALAAAWATDFGGDPT